MMREAVNDVENEPLLRETWQTLMDSRDAMLEALDLPAERAEQARARLLRYRLITDARQLRKGSSVYWFDLADAEQCKFGFVNAVTASADGQNTLVSCSNVMHRHYTLRFENCVVFQKLRPQEVMIVNMVTAARRA